MNSRGQRNFIQLPGFAARLYAALTGIDSIQRQHHEIAVDLADRINYGRLLDVGTGPGILLAEIHKLKPAIELYGLDISSAMVELAREGLSGIPVDLRIGDIRRTDYPEKYFDIVTCTGSFYLWDEPDKGLAEIYRILKQGGSAFLFETYSDHDVQAVKNAVHDNLRRENILRRIVSPRFLMQQLQMTYTTDEIVDIIRKTSFADNFSIEKIVLGGLPAWLKVRCSR